jgi:arsenate reductase-like glutaredoxin family protein
VKEQMDAKKAPISGKAALALARASAEIFATKGKNVVYLNLRSDTPDDETLSKLILGPTGNLRAPTLRKGKTLLVGFDEQTYRRVLK